MDSYIVRIYRRSPREKQTLVGLVEDVMRKRSYPFHNREELWARLNALRRDEPAAPTSRQERSAPGKAHTTDKVTK